MFNDPCSVFRTHQLEIHHKLELTNKHEKHSKATKAKEQSLKTTKIPHIHIHAYSIPVNLLAPLSGRSPPCHFKLEGDFARRYILGREIEITDKCIALQLSEQNTITFSHGIPLELKVLI